jgi:hypothetical protein
MKSALICGAGGVIGSHLASRRTVLIELGRACLYRGKLDMEKLFF